MKDLFAENFENFWKNVVCERFWELLFSEKHCRPPPPFWGGGLEWKGAQILEYTPPQPETGWHGPVYNGYFDFSIPTGIC
jgi:hypothetical protein